MEKEEGREGGRRGRRKKRKRERKRRGEDLPVPGINRWNKKKKEKAMIKVAFFVKSNTPKEIRQQVHQTTTLLPLLPSFPPSPPSLVPSFPSFPPSPPSLVPSFPSFLLPSFFPPP
jgi:hypothetical protein